MVSTEQTVSIIPQNAYLFFPSEQEKKLVDGKKIDRWIFEGDTKYDDMENKLLDQLEAEFKRLAVNLPPEWKRADSLKFLIAFSCHVDKSVKGIQEYIEWRKATIPIQLTPVILDYLNSGLLYTHGRDHKFRPIIYLNCYMIDPAKMDIDQLLLTIAYFLEYVIDKLMLPGQIERWVVVEDMKGMSLTSIPFGTLKKILNFLQNNFRSRLYKLYIMNSPSSIYFTWKMVKGLLEETTVQKINFSKEHKNDDMWKHVNKSQVEEKFGGTAPNITQSFWPPKENKENNFLEGENGNLFLRSKEEYKKLYSEGKLEKYRVCKELVE